MGDSETNEPKGRAGEILLTLFHAGIVALGFLASLAAYFFGLLFNFLFVLLLTLVFGILVSRIIGLSRRTLEFGFALKPFSPDYRKYLSQWFNQSLFAALAGLAVQLAVIPAQFSASDFRMVQAFIWASAGFLI